MAEACPSVLCPLIVTYILSSGSATSDLCRVSDFSRVPLASLARLDSSTSHLPSLSGSPAYTSCLAIVPQLFITPITVTHFHTVQTFHSKVLPHPDCASVALLHCVGALKHFLIYWVSGTRYCPPPLISHNTNKQIIPSIRSCALLREK